MAIASSQDKYAPESVGKETSSHQPLSGTSDEPLVKKIPEPHSGTSGFYAIGQPLGSIRNKIVEPVSAAVPASTDTTNDTTIEPSPTQHKSTGIPASSNAKNTSTIEAAPTPKDPSNLR